MNGSILAVVLFKDSETVSFFYISQLFHLLPILLLTYVLVYISIFRPPTYLHSSSNSHPCATLVQRNSKKLVSSVNVVPYDSMLNSMSNATDQKMLPECRTVDGKPECSCTGMWPVPNANTSAKTLTESDQRSDLLPSSTMSIWQYYSCGQWTFHPNFRSLEKIGFWLLWIRCNEQVFWLPDIGQLLICSRSSDSIQHLVVDEWRVCHDYTLQSVRCPFLHVQSASRVRR